MSSPVNNITTFTYKKADFEEVMTQFTSLRLNLPNITDSLLSFPTTSYSTDGRYILNANFTESNPPFGILITDTEKPDQAKKLLAETFATVDANNFVVFEEGWSMSNVTINTGEVTEYTISYSSVPPRTLQELLNHIHAVRTSDDLSSEYASLFSEIQKSVENQESSQGNGKNYYFNHTGRELYRKLFNYGLSELIPTPHDSGFRPDSFSS